LPVTTSANSSENSTTAVVFFQKIRGKLNEKIFESFGKKLVIIIVQTNNVFNAGIILIESIFNVWS
jgi:hypothetical protein